MSAVWEDRVEVVLLDNITTTEALEPSAGEVSEHAKALEQGFEIVVIDRAQLFLVFAGIAHARRIRPAAVRPR